MESSITIKIDEDVPVKATLNNGNIVVELDDYFNPFTLTINREVAERLREELQEANEEKTNAMYEDELSEKDAIIEKLENIVEQYEEQNDAYREKLTESCSPF